MLSVSAAADVRLHGAQVFKVARALAPAVIYIDEVEKVSPALAALACMCCLRRCTAGHAYHSCGRRAHASLPQQVFIMDKKKARTFGGVEPFNRIRKELAREARPTPAWPGTRRMQRGSRNGVQGGRAHAGLHCIVLQDTHLRNHVLVLQAWRSSAAVSAAA